MVNQQQEQQRNQNENIENIENNAGRIKRTLAESKGLAALAGSAAAARRSALADKSNAGGGGVISGVNRILSNNGAGGGVRTLRNLRSTTRTLGKSSEMPNGSTIDKPSISVIQEDKENIAPSSIFPLIKPHREMEISSKKNAEVLQDWDDLDAEDHEDPLMVSEYVVEIFEYMKLLEDRIMPSSTFMESQKELNWHSRSVLIDWMIEVQWKLKLLPETLFLSVNIIDRFLSKRSVSLVKLQLVGMAATLLASKYEEVLSPSIANFVYLADNAYDEQELLKAERYMLHVLDFSLAYPSPLVFLRRISKAENYDVRSRTLAKYFMELTLLDVQFVSCPPSMVAAVSVYLARKMLKSGAWTSNLAHYSGDYSVADVAVWADLLIDFLKKPVVYEAVFKKYSLKKLMRASLFVQDWMHRKHGVPVHTLRESGGKSVFDV